MAWRSPSFPLSREDDDAPSSAEPFGDAAVLQAVNEIGPKELKILLEEHPHAPRSGARGSLAPVRRHG